jgi:hypothetical protein
MSMLEDFRFMRGSGIHKLNGDGYEYNDPILFEFLLCTLSLGAAPLVGLCRLCTSFELASFWARTRYAKNKEPMGRVLIT